MPFDINLFEPIHSYLPLPVALNDAWQQSQRGATQDSRWNAYLNQISLDAVLSWLHADQDAQAKAQPHRSALPSFWELVNGTAICCNQSRMVLVPSEALDMSELRVPQEWVDIPSWAADYYLGVTVNPDDLNIRVWGFCTHQQLKRQENYDDGDRTYVMAEDDLITDLTVLWAAQALNLEEPTRAAIAPLPTLPLAQAQNLLRRLSNPAIVHPRLAIPFEQWGALLEHGGWRQRLAEQRQGEPESYSMAEWLQRGVTQLGQQLGWAQVQFQSSPALARGLDLSAPATSETVLTTALVRQLRIAERPYELRVLPLGTADARIWRIELRSQSPDGQIPANFTLRLLSEDLQPFDRNEDIAITPVEQLYIDVTLEPGEGLVWEVDPMPEDQDREILRF
jgi:Protein of unknown function (DUF1822)